MTEKELVEAVLEHVDTAAHLLVDYNEKSTIADKLYHMLIGTMVEANKWLLNHCPLEIAPNPRSHSIIDSKEA